MSDEEMAKVKVHRNIPIIPTDASGNRVENVVSYYEAGKEYTAPRAHIDQIVKAGAGEHVSDQAKGQNVAENQDAFKSGSDNVSV